MLIARVKSKIQHEKYYDFENYKIKLTQAHWKEIPDNFKVVIEADIGSDFLAIKEVDIDKKSFKDKLPVVMDEGLNKAFPVKFWQLPRIVKPKQVLVPPIEIKKEVKEEPEKKLKIPKTRAK
jgi:hypothetical protein